MGASKITEQISERIAGTGFAELDSSTVSKVKDAIGDGLAVSVAGCKERPVSILANYVRSIEAKPVATVWGYGYKTSAASAALVNAASAHVLDYEPMSSPSTHAVSPVVPVAFAVAEVEGRSGREIVAACAKGFEIQHRLLYAAKEPPRGERRFHPPGVVGVMGAAVTAAHLLGLDAARLRSALGIAASRAGALLANGGTMTKCTHTGYAASGGLEAALLASQGFGANEEILEHPQGYIGAFLGGAAFDQSRLFDFGKPFRIVEPGLAYKFFPSKYPTQFGITAALELHEKITDPSRIKVVRMTTPVMRDVDRPQPKTGLEGKFSFQYTAAVALLDGSVGAESFSDKRRFSPDVVGLLPKIELTQSENIPGEFIRMHVEIEVETHDGSICRTECRKPKGFWGVPIKPEEHLKKMRDCMSRVLTEDEIGECQRMIAQLEQLDTAGVRKVVELVGRAQTG